MTTTTQSTTTIAQTTTTAAPVTVATTQRPTTAPAPTTPPMTTTSPEPTTLPTTPSPTTPAPTTLPPPEVITWKEEVGEAGESVVVTQGDTEGVAPSDVPTATDLVPVTLADGLSVDLDPVVPLMIPPHDLDSSPLEVLTESPPSNPQEAEGALSVAEPPTPTSSGFPLPTPFPMSQPDDSEPSVYLDQAQMPTPAPTQESQTDGGSPDTDSEVLLWPKEETDIHAESAIQPENDTATFSAATVLSGDGEVDQASPSYPHLVDTDSELDYQYDPADAFLPVSLAASLIAPLLFSSSTSSQSFSSLPQLSASDQPLLSCHRNKVPPDLPVCPDFPAFHYCPFPLMCLLFLHLLPTDPRKTAAHTVFFRLSIFHLS